MIKRVAGGIMLAAAATVFFAPSASATIHPIVESFDCANAQAFAHHPLGDPADPPGQTPGEAGSTRSDLRAVAAVTKNFTDLSSPAVLGHKLNGTCGKVGQ